MQTVPYEILRNEIMLNLPIQDLGAMLKVNKYFNQIGSDQNFWKQKLSKDYFVFDKLEEYDWKTFYIKITLKKIRKLPFSFYTRDYHSDIWMKPSDNGLDLVKRILNKVSHQLPIQIDLVSVRRNQIRQTNVYTYPENSEILQKPIVYIENLWTDLNNIDLFKSIH